MLIFQDNNTLKPRIFLDNEQKLITRIDVLNPQYDYVIVKKNVFFLIQIQNVPSKGHSTLKG